MLSVVTTWILCGILLVLASTYGFSFERGSHNTTIGSSESMVAAGDAEESGIISMQKNVMYFAILLLLFFQMREVGAEFRRNLLISSLLLWTLMSCAWSTLLNSTLINGLRMCLDVGLAFYLVRRYAMNDLLKLLLLVGSVAAIGSIVLVVVLPQYGLGGSDLLYALGAWQGIFGRKNICGRMMTLLLLPAFFVKLEGRSGKIFRSWYIAVVLFVIAMTHSTGSWFLCATCIAFIGAMHLAVRLRQKDALSVGVALAGVGSVALVAIAANLTTLLVLIGKDPSGTGRSGIYAAVLNSIMKHPLLGYGYFAFWTGLIGESANITLQLNWPGLGYAENGILELWVELGAVAVALYGLIYFGAVKNAIYCFRRSPSKGTMWCMSLLFYVLFTNLWAGNLLTPSNLECVLPFIAYAGLKDEARRIHGLQAL